MAADKTSLSAGAIIREMLINDEAVMERVNKIYPITTDDSTLPYIVYRRASLTTTPTKAQSSTVADSVQFDVSCYTEKYAEGVELAECVRSALDCKQYVSVSGLYARSIILSDAEEGWENDAFVQQLSFTVKI